VSPDCSGKSSLTKAGTASSSGDSKKAQSDSTHAGTASLTATLEDDDLKSQEDDLALIKASKKNTKRPKLVDHDE
jgi:hypothetical protein